MKNKNSSSFLSATRISRGKTDSSMIWRKLEGARGRGHHCQEAPPCLQEGPALESKPAWRPSCLRAPLCRSLRAPGSVLWGLVARSQDTLPFVHPGRMCQPQSPRTSPPGALPGPGTGPRPAAGTPCFTHRRTRSCPSAQFGDIAQVWDALASVSILTGPGLISEEWGFCPSSPAASPPSLLCFPSLSVNWACLNCKAMDYNGKKKVLPTGIKMHKMKDKWFSPHPHLCSSVSNPQVTLQRVW